MNFEKVLDKLIVSFDKNNIDYGLIGGFALGLWGVVRATADLDFLVDKQKEAVLKETMKRFDYNIFLETENVIQFDNNNDILGNIDFLYAFRTPSLEMLKRAVTKDVFDEKIRIKVVIPEDLIGLKIQSLVNNPERKVFDWADIESLTKIYHKKLKWDIVEGHFSLYGLINLYQQLKGKYES